METISLADNDVTNRLQALSRAVDTRAYGVAQHLLLGYGPEDSPSSGIVRHFVGVLSVLYGMHYEVPRQLAVVIGGQLELLLAIHLLRQDLPWNFIDGIRPRLSSLYPEVSVASLGFELQAHGSQQLLGTVDHYASAGSILQVSQRISRLGLALSSQRLTNDSLLVGRVLNPQSPSTIELLCRNVESVFEPFVEGKPGPLAEEVSWLLVQAARGRLLAVMLRTLEALVSTPSNVAISLMPSDVHGLELHTMATWLPLPESVFERLVNFAQSFTPISQGAFRDLIVESKLVSLIEEGQVEVRTGLDNSELGITKHALFPLVRSLIDRG